MGALKETDIARPVVAYLREFGWDVHQEVALNTGSARADIVAVRGPVLWVLEAKASFSWPVIEQADYWVRRSFATQVSIVVPPYKHTPLKLAVLRERRIGAMVVEAHGVAVRELVRPWVNHRADTRWLRRQLCEETRTYAEAGNAASRYWSPFRRTCSRIVEELTHKRRPLTTKELVKAIQHHYSSHQSATGSLLRWAQAGAIPGVKLLEGRPVRWALDTWGADVLTEAGVAEAARQIAAQPGAGPEGRTMTPAEYEMHATLFGMGGGNPRVA